MAMMMMIMMMIMKMIKGRAMIIKTMGCECASTCVVAFDCLIVCVQFLCTAISIIATRAPFGAEKNIF